ncbi:MAG: flavin reductase family protein [Pseudonocardiaceae bacterium]
MNPHDRTGAQRLTVRTPGEQVDVGRFRDLMSSFPTGVSVVTTMDSEGRPWGATCSSVSSVTLAPPTLLVCLREQGGTLHAVLTCGRFAVNLLHASGQRAAVVFSSLNVDKFAEVPWQPWSPSELPFLHRDAFSVAACEVAGEVQVGDHRIVIGRVFDIRVSAGIPLLYGLRRYASWPLAVTPDGGCPLRADAQIVDGDIRPTEAGLLPRR